MIYCNAKKAIRQKLLNMELYYNTYHLIQCFPMGSMILTTNNHSADRSIVVSRLVQLKSNSSNIQDDHYINRLANWMLLRRVHVVFGFIG